MADLRATSTLGARLDEAGQALQRVTSTRSTSWAVEGGNPAERTARASERLLELNEASALGIRVLVETARKDSKWVVRTAILTMAITALTLAALIVAIFTLRAA
jgi:hypothetical protein